MILRPPRSTRTATPLPYTTPCRSSGEGRKRLERRKLDALVGYCEPMRCRRQVLLASFGEEYAAKGPGQPCGNCDNCLTPAETWDATVAAQKALSCVYRSGQRFGVAHLVDILRGADNERTRQFGHEIGRAHV